MLLFFERDIRGGLVQVTGRHARANHRFMGASYNPSDKDCYLSYFDAVNLYGYSMQSNLANGDFKWVDNNQVQNFDVKRAITETDRGYVLEVDLDYPDCIHDALRDLPPCPESIIPPDTTSRQVKLLSNLLPKRRYVILIQNLVQALDLGIHLKKI